MSETLWQKAYDEYVHENSYQGKLEKENKRLKAKLEKIEQILQTRSFTDDIGNACYLDDSERVKQIREVLEKE